VGVLLVGGQTRDSGAGWVLLVGLRAVMVGFWWWSAFGGIVYDGGAILGVRVRWLALWASSGPSQLPA
jgi:hypothetical protein